MSLRCSFAELPPELLDYIFEHLDRPAQKAFRCLCKQFCAVADPSLFSTIALDLDQGGCKSICAISGNSQIRTLVKTLQLERRTGLRNFGDFQTWHDSTIFSYDDPESLPLDLAPQMRAKTFSKEMWEALSRDDRYRLYQEYEQERRDSNMHVQELASAAYSLFVSGDDLHTATAFQNAPFTKAQNLLSDLDSAISKLPNLTGLTHCPAHIGDAWEADWRQLRFHPDALILGCSVEHDMEIDALQLLLVLRAFTLSSSPARSLRSAELYTAGIAFWTSVRLRHLLDWVERTTWGESFTSHPDDLTLYRWIDNAETPSSAFLHLEGLTRQLCAVERAFTLVTDLSWVVHSEENLPAACQFLARILRMCQCLKAVQLSVRYNPPFREDHLYWNDRSPRELPTEEKLNELTSASTKLLRTWAMGPYLAVLSTLELSVATSEVELWGLLGHLKAIRHVTFRHVAILPGRGCWHSLIRKISEGLKLASVKLFALEDVWPDSPRLILDPKAPAWKDLKDSSSAYAIYESSIVDYVLGKTSSFPVLSAIEFTKMIR